MLFPEVIEVKTKRQINAFIKFPLFLYRDDRFYAPQLTRDLKVYFSSKNPFFRHSDVKFFLAKRDGKVVGRIASIINRRHIEFHNENAGFFGFFESINDTDVSTALLKGVYDELKERGMEIMRGPMNFSTNEECGFLTEGFDMPPMLMTPYNPSYYNKLMENFAMSKAKDLYAFIYEVQDELPDKVLRVASLAEKKGIKVRSVEKRNFISHMLDFKEVYNSAWHKNWGFIPLADDELLYSAGRLKLIAVPDLILIAEKDGMPVGFLGMIPDYNVVLRHMHGSLNPVTILKALYYSIGGSKKVADLRLLILGIKAEYRNKGVDALLFREGFKGIKKGNYKRVEFSWILEDNTPMLRIIEMVGGKLYKKYRIYEKVIEQQNFSSADQQRSRKRKTS